jgi:hypothetical protein
MQKRERERGKREHAREEGGAREERERQGWRVGGREGGRERKHTTMHMIPRFRAQAEVPSALAPPPSPPAYHQQTFVISSLSKPTRASCAWEYASILSLSLSLSLSHTHTHTHTQTTEKRKPRSARASRAWVETSSLSLSLSPFNFSTCLRKAWKERREGERGRGRGELGGPERVSSPKK